jgi:CheY-like chemotaxis protein
MNILVLEDDSTRQQQFLHLGIGHNVIVVDSAHDAIRELEQMEWDLCFLDHDLGGQVFQASGVGTGFEVAQWIAENPEHCPRRVVVHSLNPQGAGAMLEILGDKAIPLTWAWTRPMDEILKLLGLGV